MPQLRLILFVLTFVPMLAQAQLTDSLKVILHSKPSLDFKLDSRNAFIANRRANIWGVKFGLIFRSKLSLGLGYNFLKSEVTHNEQVWVKNEPVSTEMHFKLRYISIYADYIYYKKNKWQLSVPVQIGLGKTFYNYTLLSNDYRKEGSFVFLYEPCLSAQYKFIRFMSVGTEMGLRLVMYKKPSVSEQLTAPIYVFRLNIYWGELINYMWPQNKIPKIILDNI